MPRNPKPDRDGGVVVERKTKQKLEKPKMYRVLLHNDDFTTMEFVVAILREVFNHNEVDATRIMLHVHHNGIGVAGVFTYEIAETKVHKTLELAKEHQYPLMCTMEPEE
jgi:ATP-dependent Clp protease adaptor protein ClpS